MGEGWRGVSSMHASGFGIRLFRGGIHKPRRACLS